MILSKHFASQIVLFMRKQADMKVCCQKYLHKSFSFFSSIATCIVYVLLRCVNDSENDYKYKSQHLISSNFETKKFLCCIF
uniref:Uncharacterized protein n=1 Tax=Onchocerca volvulus TaxID=6282 RepID=A0A8R1U1P3_ONCVO